MSPRRVTTEDKRNGELETVATFIARRCVRDPSEFLPFRELFAAYKQFLSDVSRETHDDVEASVKLRPNWDSLTLGEQALIRVRVRESFGPAPVIMGQGMFGVALMRMGFEPIRRRVPGHREPINVIVGLRLIEVDR